jgi:yecA family protein
MNITTLHGFLTALAIGPGLPPGRWMPVIWGGKSGPVVESAEQALRILSLIMRSMNMTGAMHSSPYSTKAR